MINHLLSVLWIRERPGGSPKQLEGAGPGPARCVLLESPWGTQRRQAQSDSRCPRQCSVMGTLRQCGEIDRADGGFAHTDQRGGGESWPKGPKETSGACAQWSGGRVPHAGRTPDFRSSARTDGEGRAAGLAHTRRTRGWRARLAVGASRDEAHNPSETLPNSSD